MGYAVVVLLVFLLCHEVSSVSILPHKHQTISLLKFKQSFTIDTSPSEDCQYFYRWPYPKTSSWNMSSDCCSWDGVVCDETTGHVIELDLSCSGLVGKIDSNSSLFQLSHLQRLDLSYNNFSNSHISPKFGKFSSLTHLNLSKSCFSGQVPSEISHLSKLHSLCLFNYFDRTMLRLAAHDFKLLLQNLTQLRELNLIGINISSTIPVNFSSHLTTLFLGDNGLYGMIPESIFQLPNLETLSLFNNDDFSGYFPKIKWNSSAIKWLMLSDMNFSDNILEPIGNLTSLQALILLNCNLRGPIPEFLSNLTRIESLDLSDNSLNGTIPSGMLSLPSLRYLYLSDNQFSGQIEDFKSNSLVEIDLSNNQLQGHLPNSIQDLVNLTWLNISFNNFSGSVDSIPLQSLKAIDLRSNFLQGSLPIPPISTKYFFISHNKLTEEIPTSICNLTSLVMLDFSRNNLRGEIPQCLGNITALQVLDMSHNNLSGNIPTTFRKGSSLSSLNHGNKLEGKIPQSLTNCKQLEVVDLGDNHLNDTFPLWLGTLPKLKVLSLRSNKLHGSIGTLTTQNLFPQLRILDLSSNAFTKDLPTSLFQHLKAMRIIDQTTNTPSDGRDEYYEDSVVVVSKGLELEVVRILFLYTTVDLSNNKFEGHIPATIGDLIALRVLNISHNALDGPIPRSLGSLSLVESLDLSSNHLVGEIPAEFSSLTSLEVLNLSYNHLEGCIPQGTQLQTFEINSYEGNDRLSGFPVSKGCGNDRGSGTNDAVSGQLEDEESDSEFWSDFWKAALMGYGSGLCIGLSIIYFMISSGKPIWLARIIVVLEHKLMMGRRKKQRRQRNYRRRSNQF